MSGLVKSVFGNGESTQKGDTVVGSMTEEERKLVELTTQLAQKQLDSIDQLQPFQQELVKQSLAQLQQQGALDTAMNSAVSPEDQAKLAKMQYDQAMQLGPMQQEIAQMQLDAMKQGGRATPEQLDAIKSATDASIESGSNDIDLSTKRGIGLIADEMANARGMRLSDAPIGSEAALLARGGEDQKASLIKNLRAGQATAALNYPLAVQQMQSGIGLSQQNVAQAAQNFQADLRQRAYQNRLALAGATSSGGIGLASVGSGAGASALGSLSSVRTKNISTSGSSFDPASYMKSIGGGIGAIGAIAGGIGALMA